MREVGKLHAWEMRGGMHEEELIDGRKSKGSRNLQNEWKQLSPLIAILRMTW